MKKLLIILAFSLLSLAAFAQGTSTSTMDYQATLEWSPSLVKESGAPLSLDEIKGYLIRYRRLDAEQYAEIALFGADNTQYTFTDLDAGAYEFSIATVDTSDRYSVFSDPITHTFGDNPGKIIDVKLLTEATETLEQHCQRVDIDIRCEGFQP